MLLLAKIFLSGENDLYTGLVLYGLALTFGTGLYMTEKVRIGVALYATIKGNKDALEQIAKLSSRLNHYRADVSIIIDETNRDRVAQTEARLNGLKQEIGQGFSAVLGLVTTEEKRITIHDAQTTWSEFLATVENDLLPAIARGDRGAARQRLEEGRTAS